MVVGIRHADHMAPSILKKLTLTSLTNAGCSASVVGSQTQITEFFFYSSVMKVLRIMPYPQFKNETIKLKKQHKLI
jgi:hypothetical protein